MDSRLNGEFPDVLQPWYADDAAKMSAPADVAACFRRLQELGPHFGYHPSPSKSWCICSAAAEPPSRPAAQRRRGRLPPARPWRRRRLRLRRRPPRLSCGAGARCAGIAASSPRLVRGGGGGGERARRRPPRCSCGAAAEGRRASDTPASPRVIRGRRGGGKRSGATPDPPAAQRLRRGVTGSQSPSSGSPAAILIIIKLLPGANSVVTTLAHSNCPLHCNSQHSKKLL